MENTRALFLLTKESLSEEDKEFLKQHIESLDNMVRFFETQKNEAQSEVLYWKDMLDKEREIHTTKLDQIRRIIDG